jgi:hypothetical protein
MKLAFSTTLDSSTPKCSRTIFFTRSATSLIVFFLDFLGVEIRHAGCPPEAAHFGFFAAQERR